MLYFLLGFLLAANPLLQQEEAEEEMLNDPIAIEELAIQTAEGTQDEEEELAVFDFDFKEYDGDE